MGKSKTPGVIPDGLTGSGLSHGDYDSPLSATSSCLLHLVINGLFLQPLPQRFSAEYLGPVPPKGCFVTRKSDFTGETQRKYPTQMVVSLQ